MLNPRKISLVLAVQMIFSAAAIVRAQPVITLQPTNLTVLSGGTATFTVAVSGTGPFTYQWLFNSNNLPNSIITTVAGSGTNNYSGDGAAATNATLASPSGVAVDAVSNLFIADSANNRVRKVGTNGVITTVAGNGTAAYSGDGAAATNASLSGPRGVAVDAAGNLFIADFFNHCIRKVGTNGVITTVAGNGSGGYSGDNGAATNASLYYPVGVAVDATGNLFIADSLNYRIRKVATNGIITTVAGDGSGGYGGDNAAATAASLYAGGVTVDGIGNLFISDNGNSRIRKVGTNGIITTVAGNGYYAFSGDGGVATNASLTSPSGVAFDAFGNYYIVDYANYRIREVTASSNIISTVAGNGVGAYSGDGGSATNASLNLPKGVAVDAGGNVFIADYANNRVRKVAFAGPALVLKNVTTNNAGYYQVIITDSTGSVTSSAVAYLNVVFPPAITSQPAGQAASIGGSASFSVTATGTATLAYQWRFNGTNLLGQTATNLNLANLQITNAGNYSVVVTNNYGSVTSSVALLSLVLPGTFSSTVLNPDHSVTLTLSTTTNVSSRVLAATNLIPPVVWLPIYTNSNGGVWQFTDTNTALYPTRFFRLATP